ncbi:MAG: substrate binding domain-containing protein, partial [Pseudomonadota bacterium]
FGGLIATELFPVLRDRHPNLTLVMRPDYAFEDMQDPGTDLAFRVGTFKDDRLVALELGAFSRWLVATPDIRAQYAPKSPADLATLPCLTFRGDRPGATWRFVKAGTEENVKVSGPIAVRSFGILLELVHAGQGFANLPDFMVRNEIQSGTLARCLNGYDAPAYPIFLTFRPGARNVARISAVIETAEEIVPRMLRK